MRSIIFFCISGLLPLLALSQSSFSHEHYKIYWDSARSVNYILDTHSMERVEIDYPFTNYPGKASFQHGFVYVRTGDMKGLMDLKGNHILPPCHFIRFNAKDSIISAYICGEASWILLDFKGNTINKGTAGQNNYCPSLGKEMNPAKIWDKESKKALWGFLDKKGNWVIQPVFEEVKDFDQDTARVKFEGRWGLIDKAGEFLIEPKY